VQCEEIAVITDFTTAIKRVNILTNYPKKSEVCAAIEQGSAHGRPLPSKMEVKQSGGAALSLVRYCLGLQKGLDVVI
jgi:hypothetical protein